MQSSSTVITADNVRYLASFVDDSVTVSGHEINSGTGSTSDELLLRIPLTCPKELDVDSTVRVTVALEPIPAVSPHDRDPHVGLSDGVNDNLIRLSDHGHRPTACQLIDASVQDGEDIDGYSPVPSHYTLLFVPFYRYGACHTDQNGTYVNTGRFNDQLLLRKQNLSLVVYREDPNETYSFKYFVVECLHNDKNDKCCHT